MAEYSLTDVLTDRSDTAVPLAAEGCGSVPPPLLTKSHSLPPTVLIVEFRDEVYASLEATMVDEGFVVQRVRFGSAVPARINRLKPQLVLISAEMPYESGWLVACKLMFSHPRQVVWLYGARDKDRIAQRQSICGVDQFIAYGGVLRRLIEQLRQEARRWWAANRGVDHFPRGVTRSTRRARAAEIGSTGFGS